MEELRNDMREQQVLEGEILPPLKQEPEQVKSHTEREAPVIHLSLAEIKETAAKDPDIALTYILNLQPMVEVEPKQPIEELFEKATEGLLIGTDKTVRGAARLLNYRSLRQAE